MVEFSSLDSLTKINNYPSILRGKTVLLYCYNTKKDSALFLKDNFSKLGLKKLTVLFLSNPNHIQKYVQEKGNVIKNHNLYNTKDKLQKHCFVEKADIVIGR